MGGSGTEPGGPAWLGIGAQRSGTTWLSDLLCEHPLVAVPGGKKEQHELYRGLLAPWDTDSLARYRARFQGADPRGRVGEWTPFYLMAPWAATAAAAALPDSSPIFVILRDPVERFESAIRYWLTLTGGTDTAAASREWVRTRGSNALWAGMYATQLESWANAVGRDRIVVLQYEQVRANPQRTLDCLWTRIGLDPVSLDNVATPSTTSSRQDIWSLDSVPGLRGQLQQMYRPETDRLCERWAVDISLWQ